MKDYISELSSPSISPESISGIEVQSYLNLLENSRQAFIGNVAQSPKSVIKAYLTELKETKTVIDKRGFAAIEKEAVEMVKAEIKGAGLVHIYSFLDNGLLKSLNRTISFLEQILGEESSTEPLPQKQMKEHQSIEREEKPNKFKRRLEEYGEFLSVRDLTEIFAVDRRTITNWEKKGYLINVAKTSDETNILGRKKRGAEKRYKRDEVLKNIHLNELFNSKL